MQLTPATDLAALLGVPLVVDGTRQVVIDWARHGANHLAGGVACTWRETIPNGRSSYPTGRVENTGKWLPYGTRIDTPTTTAA